MELQFQLCAVLQMRAHPPYACSPLWCPVSWAIIWAILISLVAPQPKLQCCLLLSGPGPSPWKRWRLSTQILAMLLRTNDVGSYVMCTIYWASTISCSHLCVSNPGRYSSSPLTCNAEASYLFSTHTSDVIMWCHNYLPSYVTLTVYLN